MAVPGCAIGPSVFVFAEEYYLRGQVVQSEEKIQRKCHLSDVAGRRMAYSQFNDVTMQPDCAVCYEVPSGAVVCL